MKPATGMVGPMRVAAVGVEGSTLNFEFYCTICGGYELEIRDAPGVEGDDRMAYCRACGEWVARFSAFKVHLRAIAAAAGYNIPVNPPASDDPIGPAPASR